MGYLDELFGLSGKTVVITGGSGVLAGAMADTLLRAGAHVCLWGRHEETLKEAAARIGSAAGAESRIGWAVTDAASETSLQEAIAATTGRFARIDVLINGVGGNRGKSAFIDTDMAVFEEVVRLNLVAGCMLPTKVFCRHWIAQGQRGCVINLCSMSSYVPLSGSPWPVQASRHRKPAPGRDHRAI